MAREKAGEKEAREALEKEVDKKVEAEDKKLGRSDYFTWDEDDVVFGDD